MRGTLFEIGGIGAPAYFILLLTGFLFATAAGTAWARRIGQDPDVIVDLGLASLLMGVVGGRVLHVIADGYFWDYVHLITDPSKVDWHVEQAACPRLHGQWDAIKGVCHPVLATEFWARVDQCLTFAEFWKGGLAYYGGFIGASVGAWYLLRYDRFPFWKAADMAGFTIPLGLGFGRMGCLLAGCCFGVETKGPFGLSFPSDSPASELQFKKGELPSLHAWSHPVQPTQIYESAACLLIALVCLGVVHGRKRYDGQVFVAFLGLYAVARFVLEFWRDDDRGALLGLSTSQLIGIALVIAAAVIHVRRMRRATTAIAGKTEGLAVPR